jgi:NitT/TauT family transport system substrate-binding protein
MIRKLALMLVAATTFASAAQAEVNEVRIARQFGLVHLPLIVMEDKKLIEKHAEAAGLKGMKATYHKLASTGGINEALLAGQLDFAPNGAPSLLTIWDKTKGTSNEVRGLIAVNEFTFFLNVNRPDLKSIKDLNDKDRIAVSAVKVSVPAILLQMAAMKEWGKENYTRLDRFTVSMAHPDGMAALLSRREITGHFTSPPYMHLELEKPGITKMLSSDDILGGATVGTILFGTSRFVNANPKASKAVVDAVKEAVNYVNSNPKEAAELYLRASGDKAPLDEVVRQLTEPGLVFIATPRNFMTYARFMHEIGTTKNVPATWKDAFFPLIHDLPGS